MKRTFLLLVVFTGLLLPLTTSAAYQIFLQVAGIPGESTDARHANWIDVLSFSHAMSRTDSISRPTHGDLMVTKNLDKSSPLLNLRLNDGTHLPTVNLELKNSNGEVFYKIELEDVTISNISSGGSAGADTVSETVAFSYRRIRWTYYPTDASGRLQPPIVKGWDLAGNVEW